MVSSVLKRKSSPRLPSLPCIIMHRLCRSFFGALRGEVPRRLATGELSAKARTSGP